MCLDWMTNKRDAINRDIVDSDLMCLNVRARGCYLRAWWWFREPPPAIMAQIRERARTPDQAYEFRRRFKYRLTARILCPLKERSSRFCGANRFRFIPAPAGKRLSLLLQLHQPTVHPRACGEKADNSSGGYSSIGSSPRLRGKDCRCCSSCTSQRFIPAPAGKRECLRELIKIKAVHPRACGEKTVAAAPAAPANGSSPRLSRLRFVTVAPGARGCECGCDQRA